MLDMEHGNAQACCLRPTGVGRKVCTLTDFRHARNILDIESTQHFSVLVRGGVGGVKLQVFSFVYTSPFDGAGGRGELDHRWRGRVFLSRLYREPVVLPAVLVDAIALAIHGSRVIRREGQLSSLVYTITQEAGHRP